MRRSLLFVLLGAAGLLFLFKRQSAQAAEASAIQAYNDASDDVQVAGENPDYWFMSDNSQGNFIWSVDMGSPEQNLLAFLALIRKFETNDKYNVLYGGETFSDYSHHPNRRIPINLPGYEGKFSSAAGAYQFLYKTWETLASRLSLTDFTPASQDAAAVELLNEIGAIPDIQAGNFDAALKLASSQWASLPYSPAKQNPKTIASANEFLARYLDSLG